MMMKKICTALAISLALALPAHAADRDFTVVAWGGAIQDAKREIMFKPFGESKGITVLDDVYTGGWAPFKAMQDTGIIPWDVIQVETAEMVRGCEEGVFAKIDWEKIGYPENHFIPAAVSECGVGHIVWSLVISYNEDTLDTHPTKPADFWDVAKWPGKRGIRRGPTSNLEFALMADGVAPQNVYSVLSTAEGIDRAFAKLDEIKPHLQFWKSGSQTPEWLVSGDVTMSLGYNGRIAKAREEGKNLGIIWDNTMYAVDSWVIPADSPYVDLAHEFVRFVSDTKLQGAYSNDFAYGPTVGDAVALIDSEQMKMLPAGANLETALFLGSDEAREFWANNLEELTVRWNIWEASN